MVRREQGMSATQFSGWLSEVQDQLSLLLLLISRSLGLSSFFPFHPLSCSDCLLSASHSLTAQSCTSSTSPSSSSAYPPSFASHHSTWQIDHHQRNRAAQTADSDGERLDSVQDDGASIGEGAAVTSDFSYSFCLFDAGGPNKQSPLLLPASLPSSYAVLRRRSQPHRRS
jgi:hypothetical protein